MKDQALLVFTLLALTDGAPGSPAAEAVLPCAHVAHGHVGPTQWTEGLKLA